MSLRTWPNGLLRLGTLQGEGMGWSDSVGWLCWLVGCVGWLGVLLCFIFRERVKQGPSSKCFVINLILRVFC